MKSFNIKQLKSAIENMQIELNDKIKYLNNGGCATFTYYMSRNLRILGIEHSICYVDWSKIYLTKEKAGPINHVFLHIPNIGFVDGYRTLSRRPIQYPYYRKYKSSLSFLEYYKNIEGWNRCYETSQNSKLESIINKYINGNILLS